MVSPIIIGNANDNKTYENGVALEFTIKVDYYEPIRKPLKEQYVPYNGGHIDFRPL